MNLINVNRRYAMSEVNLATIRKGHVLLLFFLKEKDDTSHRFCNDLYFFRLVTQNPNTKKKFKTVPKNNHSPTYR